MYHNLIEISFFFYIFVQYAIIDKFLIDTLVKLNFLYLDVVRRKQQFYE